MTKNITALDLEQVDPLPKETQTYFDICEEKLGLVPNVAGDHRPRHGAGRADPDHQQLSGAGVRVTGRAYRPTTTNPAVPMIASPPRSGTGRAWIRIRRAQPSLSARM